MSDARTVKPGEAVVYFGGPAGGPFFRKTRHDEHPGDDATVPASPVSVPRQSVPPQRHVNHTIHDHAVGVVGVHVCRCGAPLLFSARQRGNGMCGPCSRGAEFRVIGTGDHDPGDEDRR